MSVRDEYGLSKAKDYFVKMLKLVKREGIEDVLRALEQGGFYTSPASRRKHLCHEGGLLLHSVNVLIAMQDIAGLEHKPIVFSDSMVICALLHDVCKMGHYTATEEMGEIKYDCDFNFWPFGHGEKSVIMLQSWGLKMTEEEMLAIRWHMGAWNLDRQNYDEIMSYNAAVNKTPLVTLLQLADIYSTHMLEKKYETNGKSS